MTRAARRLMLAAVAVAGCAGNPRPAADAETPAAAEASGAAAQAGAPAGTDARFDIPPGHMPPPGMCRVWVPGEPPGQQAKDHPVGQCSKLRAAIPEGAWLVYRPTDGSKYVRVWQYGENGRVTAQRIYDAVTGQLVRHVAPGGS